LNSRQSERKRMFHFEPPESELFVQDPGFSTIAVPLTIPAPGGKIATSWSPPFIPPGYRAGREETSL
ncbi:hypothetical protein, partial [Citrobacter braakii]|uniref:hypothetical protein n=1 Tax=Citrobacter braakii TaxID=57706 RepID=UPI00397CCCDF